MSSPTVGKPRLASATTSSATGAPTYSETLPRVAESAAIARRLVQHALAVWHLDVLAEPACLVVSELVANAVEHARGECIRVIVSRVEGGGVRVGVVDKSQRVPSVQAPDADEVSGRGLLIVQLLAQRWGTTMKAWGKTVWAEVRP